MLPYPLGPCSWVICLSLRRTSQKWLGSSGSGLGRPRLGGLGLAWLGLSGSGWRRFSLGGLGLRRLRLGGLGLGGLVLSGFVWMSLGWENTGWEGCAGTAWPGTTWADWIWTESKNLLLDIGLNPIWKDGFEGPPRVFSLAPCWEAVLMGFCMAPAAWNARWWGFSIWDFVLMNFLIASFGRVP